MPQVELVLPKMGESIAEATIIKWLKKPGDKIEEDDIILEVATDKIDSEVPSPVSGVLVEYLCGENEVVQIGSVIAIIDTGGGEPGVTQPAPVREEEEQRPSPKVAPPDIQEQTPGLDQLGNRPVQRAPTTQTSSVRFYSPLVKNIAAEEGIPVAELDSICGTGSEGRVTREDIMGYLASRDKREQPAAPSVQAEERQTYVPPVQEHKPEPAPVQAQEREEARPASAPQQKAPKPSQVATAVSSGNSNDEIIEMDRMRRIIADHMVMSVQTSPHVTSFVEADVTNMVKWRERVKGLFEKREGEKITFTPIFVEAVAKSLRDMPMVNVSVDGNRIIRKRDINIGLAAALPSGNLIVPVIKNADQLNMVGLTKSVNDLANRARTNKLQPDEIKDGTFTITNIGTFGNSMGTPIINQPQVAILAIGVIKKKPAVIETENGDMIAIRHMTYLSLSYDHRVVDGGLGGSFLRRVADYLENWDVDREI